MAAGLWSAFWIADEVIAKWGSDHQRSVWNALTLHVPFVGLETWLIGLLLIGLVMVFEGSYGSHRKLEAVVDDLTWPPNRPQILLESWGEPPHDDPRARFHPPGFGRDEPEYFERGFFLVNDGETTAHEVRLRPIELAPSVCALGDIEPRISAKSKGFMFVWMDMEHNIRFMPDPSRWDLLAAMAVIEEKNNAARVEQRPLTAAVAACYRDANNVWYVSWANLSHIKETKTLLFGDTRQMKAGLKPQW